MNYYVSLSLLETSVKRTEASSHKGSGGWPGLLSGGPLGPAQSSWGLSGPKDQRGPGNVRGELQASSSTVPPPLSPWEGPSPTAIVQCCWAPSRGLCPAPCTPAVPQLHPNIQANPANKPGAVPVETPGSSGPTWKPRPERAGHTSQTWCPMVGPLTCCLALPPWRASHVSTCCSVDLLGWCGGREGERGAPVLPGSGHLGTAIGSTAARPWASHMTWCVLPPLEPSQGRLGEGENRCPIPPAPLPADCRGC